MKTLNIGVIGIGVIATTKHIPCLLKRDDVKITVLCDIDTAKAEKAKAELGLADARVVSVVTGNGLKDVANAIKACGEPISIPSDMDRLMEAFRERDIHVEA